MVFIKALMGLLIVTGTYLAMIEAAVFIFEEKKRRKETIKVIDYKPE